MTLEEYESLAPKEPVYAELKALAAKHPGLLDDLLSGLEAFVRRDCKESCLVASKKQVEVYLEPPRYVLRHFPAPAALIRVDHKSRRFRIVKCLEEYGGVGESEQWGDLEKLAHGLLTKE